MQSNSSSNVPGAGVKIAPCLLLAFCFTVGLPVNVAVIVDICMKYKRYVSKVNPSILLLVLNLAVVDSVILSTLPFTAYTLIWGFTSGDTGCKMFFYILTSCLFISVSTVTGISMNYFLIVKFGVANPRMMERVSGRRREVVVLGGVWIVALLLAISTLSTRQVETRRGLLRCIRKARNDTKEDCTKFHIYLLHRPDEGDGMKTMCLLNSVINPFLYAFALRRKLNKSDASSKNSNTSDTMVNMVELENRKEDMATSV
ncbi:hypothetical protein CRUP_005752, partial [Coryphaenoides rupestris]